MTTAASGALAVSKALDALMRNDRGRLMAALIARLRDFSLAEEALQEAMISAMSHWGRVGIPDAPDHWLLQVAWRKALDRMRATKAQTRLVDDLASVTGEEAQEEEPDMIPDERLRLIFTCCHPAIEPKSQVALTLRTLGGLSTGEIARSVFSSMPRARHPSSSSLSRSFRSRG
jgi:RNA polymerase sigma-70 factor (ECF subfamily)